MRVLEGYPVHPKLGAALAISLACSLMTAPILLVQFGRVPVLGVVANALVEPVVGPLLGLALGDRDRPSRVTRPRVRDRVAGRVARGVRGLVCEHDRCSPVRAGQRTAAVAVVAGVLALAAYAWQRWRTT